MRRGEKLKKKKEIKNKERKRDNEWREKYSRTRL
jgi:hypothetical protein